MMNRQGLSWRDWLTAVSLGIVIGMGLAWFGPGRGREQNNESLEVSGLVSEAGPVISRTRITTLLQPIGPGRFGAGRYLISSPVKGLVYVVATHTGQVWKLEEGAVEEGAVEEGAGSRESAL